MRALASIALGRGLAGRRRRARLGLLSAPLAVRALLIVAAALVLWLAVNWIYQVVRKPAELLAPVSRGMAKSPPQTWRRYGPLFREYATDVVSPELLAALAQAEGQGNPLALPPWRWSLAWNPFDVYRPASSAVGMYQHLDGTFREATRYCIRDHVAVEGGPWYDPRACWLRGLAVRVVPSHAVEATSAYLDRAVAAAVGERRPPATLRQKQDLAAVIHLCGAGRGDSFARRGFRPAPRERCGAHDVTAYIARVNALKREFARVAASS